MMPVKTAAHLAWHIVFWGFVANTNANGKHYIMDPVAEHVNKRIVERKEYRELDDFEGETHDINSDLGIQPTKCRRNIANRVNAV